MRVFSKPLDYHKNMERLLLPAFVVLLVRVDYILESSVKWREQAMLSCSLLLHTKIEDEDIR